jgi:BlaI family transcriptional regulator, penicillinase repressor
MTEQRNQKPSDGELEILQILWSEGPSTVRTINERLNLQRRVGYTTTLKQMQIMHEKGLLERDEQGRSHIYKPTAREHTTQKALLDRIVETAFGGSALKLVMQALGGKRTSPEELAEIRAYLDRLEQDHEPKT